VRNGVWPYGGGAEVMGIPALETTGAGVWTALSGCGPVSISAEIISAPRSGKGSTTAAERAPGGGCEGAGRPSGRRNDGEA